MCRIQGCRGPTISQTFLTKPHYLFLLKYLPMGLIVLDSFFFLLKKVDLFLFALDLRSCVQAFSSCGERGLLSSCGAQTSGCSGFSCAPAYLIRGSGIFLDQGSNLRPCIGRRILPARPAPRPPPPKEFLTTGPPGKTSPVFVYGGLRLQMLPYFTKYSFSASVSCTWGEKKRMNMPLPQ